MPTNENHSKTVIYNYFLGQTLGFGIITSDMGGGVYLDKKSAKFDDAPV